ncbi:MAG: hypothetical protein ACKPKO_33985, partial [Candidatus Fonsibacter sp.]
METSLVSRRFNPYNSFAMPRETDIRETSHRDITGVNNVQTFSAWPDQWERVRLKKLLLRNKLCR